MQPPFKGAAWLPSITALDQSIRPAALSRRSSSWCRRSKSPGALPPVRGGGRAAELARQMAPGDPGQEHGGDRVECGALGDPRPAGRPGLGSRRGRSSRKTCQSSSRTAYTDAATSVSRDAVMFPAFWLDGGRSDPSETASKAFVLPRYAQRPPSFRL